jgi:hypothetical protein
MATKSHRKSTSMSNKLEVPVKSQNYRLVQGRLSSNDKQRIN